MSVQKKDIKGKICYQANVYYKDAFNRPKRKTSKWFKKRSEAQEAEKQIKENLNRIKYERPFKEIALEYIDSAKDYNTKATIRDKTQLLNHYLRPVLEMDIRDIKPSTVKALFNEPKFLKLGASRKNRVRGLLYSIFKYAMRVYDVAANPVEAFPTFKKNGFEEERIVYTPAQFGKVLKQVDQKHHEYGNVFLFLFLTGARLNECLSLTFNDILGKKVHIWRQYIDGEWSKLKTKKSHRKITLPALAQSILKEQYEKYKDVKGFNPGWFIFGGPKQLNDNTVRRVYNRAQENAGMPHSRLHDLRHAHASVLISRLEKKGDILKVSERLGHSKISTTLEVYAHLLEKDEDELIDILESDLAF